MSTGHRLSEHEDTASPDEGWQRAVIAALARGRQLQDAWAEAGIDEQRFHERVADDPAFRDACREAIETARQRLAQDLALIEHTVAPEPAPDSTAIAAPDLILTLFNRQMPAWAATLFGALLDGRPPDAARADAGVTEEQIRAEQERNPLFRQVWRTLQTGPRAGRRAAFEALLDRTIAAAVIATRVLPPQIDPEQPRAGWVGTFFRAWRDGRSLTEAARAARVPLEAVEEMHAQNAPFAQACALLALASTIAAILPRQREQMTAYIREQQEHLAAALRANMPLAEASATVGVAPEIALVWTRTVPEVREAYEEQQRRWREETLAREAPLAEAFLAALAEGTEPREAAEQVGWQWGDALRWRRQDRTFAQAWDDARAAGEDVRALRNAEERVGAQREREAKRKEAFLAALARGLRPTDAAREASLSQPYRLRESDPAFARAWDEAAAEGERVRPSMSPSLRRSAALAARKEAFERALAVRRSGGNWKEAAAAAGVSKQRLAQWMKAEPTLATAWQAASEEGKRARIDPAIVAQQQEQERARMERQNARAMKQRAALDARRDGKTLAAAASAAGVAVNTIYKWKQGDPDFAAAWQDASSAQGAFQRSGRPKTAARLARDEHADALLAQIVDTGID